MADETVNSIPSNASLVGFPAALNEILVSSLGLVSFNTSSAGVQIVDRVTTLAASLALTGAPVRLNVSMRARVGTSAFTSRLANIPMLTVISPASVQMLGRTATVGTSNLAAFSANRLTLATRPATVTTEIRVLCTATHMQTAVTKCDLFLSFPYRGLNDEAVPLNREVLLSPALRDTPAWSDMVGALDAVWATRIDQPLQYMLRLRDTFPAKYVADSVVSLDDLITFNKTVAVETCNLLGFDHYDGSVFSDQDYMRIGWNLSRYYTEKGTDTFFDFFGYALDAWFSLDALWTTDYIDFASESSGLIGTPVWEGGTWYPTTHVDFRVDLLQFGNLPISALQKLFYKVANINLVLNKFILGAIAPFSTLNIAMAGSMSIIFTSNPFNSNNLNIAMCSRTSITY